MIDIHCHILPALDDGVQTLDEAAAMARIAVADGISAMVATPHYWEGMFTPTPHQIRHAARSLQDRFAQESIALRLLPGQEVMIAPSVPEYLRRGDLVTVGDTGEYLLVELPVTSIPLCTEQVLFEVMALGVTPILAHPEKNFALQSQPDVLERLVQRGCLVQMDADSLAAGRRGNPGRFAARLLKAGLVHILASDGHSPQLRPPLMSSCARTAARITSADAVEQMTTGLPGRILQPGRLAMKAAQGRS